MRKYELTPIEAVLAFKQVEAHCKALKNWIARWVENDEFDKAKELVSELRAYEALYKKLNVEAHQMIDGGK